MRRLWAVSLPLFLSAFLLLSLIPVPACAEPEGEAAAASNSLNLSAECAVLLDAESGRVLYEKNAQQQHLVASTTKIMTALVTIEQAEDLDVMVTIAPEWAGIEGSSMYLEAGDVVSIRALLYGLMLNSGNDAATALANVIAGDEAAFVDWMNEYAARFGMTDTHFSNPHGLDAEDHYSTALDMAKLMVEAMKNETFREITHTRYVAIDGFELYYHNKLLNLYQYCISGKTGYTVAAGRTLVSASEKDGRLLVAVTLNAPDDWNDHIAMYEYGFNKCPQTTICQQGDCFTAVSLSGSEQAVPVYCSNTLIYPLHAGETLQSTVYLPEELTRSVDKGTVIGKVVYHLPDGGEAGKVYLVAGTYASVETGEVSYQWKSAFKSSCLLAGLYPDGQPRGTYRLDGLLSTALWHSWA